ncbi:MAG: Gfo/Idh/MocA family oxidoreductase [Deltaproteobacteria bacterium]|nr:Gfo/Idh/MocA family oxidoreductase [Deltaproteobacteria bacterium]
MKKIRTAVIGVGYLGRLHAQKYASIPDMVELVGVCDADPARARAVASECATAAFPSHESFFGRVDAVSVVTPTENHHRIALEMLSRGIDVLVEKPISVTEAEADELIREAGKKKAVLQVGHLERFNAAVAALEGCVKTPKRFEADRLTPFPNRATDVDVILDLMIHDLDIILNLASSEIESIEAFGMPVVTDKTDYATAGIRFKNGCTAQITASRVSKDKVRRLRVYQDREYITVDCANQRMFVTRGAGPSALTEEEIQIVKSDSLLEELNAFIRSCASRTAPLVSGEDGLRALQAAVRVQQAVASSVMGFSAGRPR